MFCWWCVIAITLAACQQHPDIDELAGEIQGTTYHIKVVRKKPLADLNAIRTEIDATFRNIDLKLSNYRDDSEISRFNDQTTTDWVPVSGEIAKLVAIARQLTERTGGCYDLTVKPLLDLWGFSRNENRVPSAGQIRQALAHVGMARVEVDQEHNRLRKRDPAVQIDLSSIAQGYTVAAIAQVLERHAIRDYLVEIGGEMKVKGHKPDGSSWRVAIEKPTPYTREVQRILDIHQETGTAVMTAGTYRHFFEDRGQTYSHIIDPRTGSPVTHRLLSVTVLHDDPTWADAWDTALLCVGAADAMRIAEAEQLRVLLVYAQGQSLQEYLSPAFLTAQQASAGSAAQRDAGAEAPPLQSP
jgi:FAD:protein FMN transferase